MPIIDLVELSQYTPTAFSGTPEIVGANPWEDETETSYTTHFTGSGRMDIAVANFVPNFLPEHIPLTRSFTFEFWVSAPVDQLLVWQLLVNGAGVSIAGIVEVPGGGGRTITTRLILDYEWAGGFSASQFAQAVLDGTASLKIWNNSPPGNSTIRVEQATIWATVATDDGVSLYAPPRRLGRRNDGLHMGTGRTSGMSSQQKSLRVGSGYL